jgi:WD40-like Beta Propeller Repeat
VNTGSQETSPSVTADGTLYFSSNRTGGKGAFDIYRAKLIDGKYGAPENASDAINTPGPELQVFVTPDDNLLVFVAAGRPDGQGSADLYLSKRTDGAWSAPVNLGNKINSRGADTAPRISSDRRHFYWTSTRGYGFEDQQARRLSYKDLSNKLQSAGNSFGDIYEIDLKAVPGFN